MSDDALHARLARMLGAAMPHMDDRELSRCAMLASDAGAITRRLALLCESLGLLVTEDGAPDGGLYGDRDRLADLLFMLGDMASVATAMTNAASAAAAHATMRKLRAAE